eukprot:5670760-Pyramimonas_sp.AAC.1
MHVASWHARALFHRDDGVRIRKLSIVMAGTIIALQETHGAECDVLDMIHAYHRPCSASISFHNIFRTGGVIARFPTFTESSARFATIGAPPFPVASAPI